MNTIEKYHKTRWMFVIHEEHLFIADKGSSQSHKEWLESVGVELKDQTRGYLSGKKIFFYRGEDFRVDWQVLKDVGQFLPHITYAFDLNGDEKIFCGVIKGNPGEQWKGRLCIGTVKDFISIKDVMAVIKGECHA